MMATTPILNLNDEINNGLILPREILQFIFFKIKPFNDLLLTSTVCHQWRQITAEPVFFNRYFSFDKRCKEKLVSWFQFTNKDDITFDSISGSGGDGRKQAEGVVHGKPKIEQNGFFGKYMSK
ncbi:unnamed protein product [Didymodactylos carnosus]|uniref:F-box domain-containing protein n=1 Tax=Didymodactylos carnosus TaxID=1234261 RepID=A0A815K7C2_9BILA|nr:unnamed protein product [Didymodactylos carnosus]CAF4286267.1 unnamed protein product [Didymodactylos carnosus]